MAVGRYDADETDVTFYTTGATKPGLIVCHSRAASGLSTAFDASMRDYWAELSEHYTVCVSDLGGPVEWGNIQTRDAITQIRSMLSSKFGVTGKTAILGMSMGGLAALNYTKAFPANVAYTALLAPAINLNDMRFYNATTDTNDGSTPGTYNPEINAAYGGTYNNTTQGPTYNPHFYRATYPASAVRTAMWTSPSDTVVRSQWADSFVAAQPTVERYLIRNTAGQGFPHTQVIAPALAGLSGSSYAFPGVADWCIARRSDVAF